MSASARHRAENVVGASLYTGPKVTAQRVGKWGPYSGLPIQWPRHISGSFQHGLECAPVCHLQCASVSMPVSIPNSPTEGPRSTGYSVSSYFVLSGWSLQSLSPKPCMTSETCVLFQSKTKHG